jgi:hypothetical protein
VSVAAADIEAALRAALAPTALEVEDDSHLHAGHCRGAGRPAFQRPHRQPALQRPVAGGPAPPRI